ncbi:MAG: YmaF family protein, partial [Syntrophomonas sp.]
MTSRYMNGFKKSNELFLEQNKEKHHCKKENCEIQTHVHEFLGSVMLADQPRHNHRFAGVTSQEIGPDEDHVHAILVNTDFYEDHYHEIGIRTGPPIPVGEGKHVHFVNGQTTTNDDHFHLFIFATLI